MHLFLPDVPTQKATLTTPAVGFLIVGQTANSPGVAAQKPWFRVETMSKIFRVHHGSFGHVTVLELTAELVTHAHSSANLSFWLRGAPAHVLINGVPVGHDTKTAAIIDRFVPHCLKIEAGSGAAQSLSFYLDPEWLSRMLPKHLARSFIHLDIAISPSLRDELWMLRDMLLDEMEDEFELDSALTAFLRRALVASREAASADATRDHSVRDFRIRKALALMRTNMVRNLDLEAVARESGLSRPHFFSKFRDELGLTPSIFWNSLRLEAAMQQMSSSQASLTSVASRLGFDAQCNFTRFFRQHTGVAPSEYRHALMRHTDAAALRA
jgi:AraC family transcriptional regulator